MNERIQELARQAGAQHRLNLGVEEFCFEHSELEKFAELIVRECMMVVEGFEITQEVALDEYVDYEASAVLKQHFGVEE